MIVSVIIPSYKPSDYLWDCLDSLTLQTIPSEDFEILVILNGCKDPYYTDISVYINNHLNNNIRLIQTDVSGVSNARNIGLDVANGEYITFIDDDDVVSPTYLACLLGVSSPTCIGCANSYAFFNDISEKKTNFMSKAYEACKGTPFSLYAYRKFLSPPVIKMIHKDIIGKARFPLNIRKSEDSVFCLELSPRIKDMKLASETAVYYQRLRPGSAMRTRGSKWNEIILHLRIEWEYLKVWMANPFRINVRFALSRIVACMKNLWVYLKRK